MTMISETLEFQVKKLRVKHYDIIFDSFNFVLQKCNYQTINSGKFSDLFILLILSYVNFV